MEMMFGVNSSFNVSSSFGWDVSWAVIKLVPVDIIKCSGSSNIPLPLSINGVMFPVVLSIVYELFFAVIRS